ncbi:MAG: ABC transporter permease [Thermomicrobiales bacterium]|nr:ABC transporter permease [Thermomicrobiales bacterium]
MTRRGERALGAYVAAVLVFLAVPTLIVIPSAFGTGASLTFPPDGFSLKWFRNIAAHPEFLRAFVVSITVAACATAISIVLGTAAAIALVRYRFPGGQVINMLIMTPLIFPAVVIGVASALAIGPTPLARTTAGLVLAHVVITLPYVVRTVSATLHEIDRAMSEAAQVLGANRWKTFRYVTLPLLRPGLIAGATFSLIVSFDEFTISLFLTGPDLVTLPIQIYNYVEYTIDPTIAAVSTLLVVGSGLAVLVIEKWVGLERHFRI